MTWWRFIHVQKIYWNCNCKYTCMYSYQNIFTSWAVTVWIWPFEIELTNTTLNFQGHNSFIGWYFHTSLIFFNFFLAQWLTTNLLKHRPTFPFQRNISFLKCGSAPSWQNLKDLILRLTIAWKDVAPSNLRRRLLILNQWPVALEIEEPQRWSLPSQK